MWDVPGGTKRPIIGITTYVEQARWGHWDVPAALLPLRYIERVEAAGGRAVLVPPSSDGTDELVERLDGVVFAGGSDLDPALYGAQPHPLTVGIRPERDTGEVALMACALQRDLPVLGICRGMELMTVVSGGSLVQHLPEVAGTDDHRAGDGTYALHDVRLQVGSRVHGILGEALRVPSYHHQGVESSGSLKVTGWAHDETPEAVEALDHRFAVGVLWHPEVSDDLRLFEALVAATR
jgi:putative glutamine amidotransferase